MPVIKNDPFTKNTSSSEIQGLLNNIEDTRMDAVFKKEDQEIKVDRDFIEAVIYKKAQDAANVSVFNKFLQIDTKLDKALREYQAEITVLLKTLASQEQAQAVAASQPQGPVQPQAQPSTVMPGADTMEVPDVEMKNPLPEVQV